jgi:hypothetical protein
VLLLEDPVDPAHDTTVGTAEAVRYAAGLPRVGVRSLGEQEARAIVGRMRRTWLEAVLGGLGACAAWAMGVTAGGALDPRLVETLGGPAGMAICASGVFGALAALVSARGWWRLGAAGGLVYLLAVASIGRLAPELRLPSEWITWTVAIATVVLGNAFFAVSLARRVAVVRRSAAIRADLTRARVEQYEGRPAPDARSGGLRWGGPEGRSDPAGRRLELLPTSGLVLRIDGRVPDRLGRVYVADVAPAMPHALRVALPEGVAPSRSSTELALQRRSLTPGERDELQRHIDRLRGGLGAIAAMSAITVVVTVSRLWPGYEPAGLFDLTALLWYGLMAWALVAYFRRIAAARKLEADRKLRWVVTVDAPRPLDRDPVPPKLEVLPVSQLAWTEHSAPAGWRISRL